MIAAAPEGLPPRRISNQTIQKITLPAVPLRGHEAGFHRIYYDFHGSGVNHIDSCLFLQSRIFFQNHTVKTGFYMSFLVLEGAGFSLSDFLDRPFFRFLFVGRE
jgi:hypothetical protein